MHAPLHTVPQELFRPFGHVLRIFLAVDKTTGENRGFAFVNYAHKWVGRSRLMAGWWWWPSYNFAMLAVNPLSWCVCVSALVAAGCKHARQQRQQQHVWG